MKAMNPVRFPTKIEKENIKVSVELPSQNFKTYDQVVQFLFSLEKIGIVFSLNSTRDALKILGNPHRRYPSVLVAGTNGKGSTVAMLSRCLMEAGYRVGTYTSPHLLDVRERIMLNGRMISKSDLIQETNSLCQKVRGLKRELSFFEFMTTLAFHYFLKQKIDIAIVEVGLGGRWDATNVLNPLVSVITSIDYDHQRLLGKTLKKIAFEKAGIIKWQGICVSAVQQKNVRRQYQRICHTRNAQLYLLCKDFFMERKYGLLAFRDWGWMIHSLELALKGMDHQMRNAACAIATLHLLKGQEWEISENAIRKGLKNTRWPGRLETVQTSPHIILDGAHNPSGVRALVKALKTDFTYDKLHVVAGVMADKNYKHMFKNLLPMAQTFTFVEPPVKRALTFQELFRQWPELKARVYAEPSIAKALPRVISHATKKDMICVTGSLYTVAEAKKLFI